METLFTVNAFVAVFLFLSIGAYFIYSDTKHLSWKAPLLISLLFFAYSLFTSVTEGPLMFWVEHTRSFWGNQIWFDLLLAAGVAWFLLVPQAKRLGMRLPVWLLTVALTGSIGLLAMLARTLYLQNKLEKEVLRS